jgi:predicted permease
MLRRRADLQRDLDEEMRLHLHLRAAALRAQGLPPADAAAAARHRFGNPLHLRERGMEAWRWIWIEQFAQDVRFAARTLRRSPGFTATAVLTLALAIGATTAIFSVVNGVLLQPLPFDDPERLVKIGGRLWGEDRPGTPDPMGGPLATPELEAYSRSRSLEGLASYEVTSRLLHGSSGVERVTAATVDLHLFSLLGADAIAGRPFRDDDARDVAVISARLWEERFDRDPALPGRALTIDGRPYTIVGVMPRSFQFPYRSGSLMNGAVPESRTDLWLPLPPIRDAANGAVRRGRLHTIGRITPGVSREAAEAELAIIAREVEAQYRARPSSATVRVQVQLVPLRDAVVGPVRRSLWMLFAAVGLVLAAACANMANLLLARMSIRSRELETRAAIGAGPARLVRQFLAESLLLAFAGALAGAAIAWWGTDILMKLAAARIPRAHEVSLDWQALAFLLAACVVTAVLFGSAPALTACRINARGIPRDARRATAGRGHRALRDGLVVVEVALALLLAVGAALIVREMLRLQRAETGMHTENVLTLHVTPRTTAADYYAIEERTARLPGVRAAGFTQLVPLQNWGWEGTFTIKGRSADRSQPRAELRYVTPGYFSAFGIPLVRGRLLSAADTASAPRVILVNEALARQYFPGQDPVGQELDRGTIAGVVGDVRQAGLDRPAGPEIYYPAAQNVTMASDLGMSLIVRTDGPPGSHAGAVRAAVRDVNPNLTIFNVKTMREVLADSLWQLRLYRWLIGLFAALALSLAGIGLYGVIAYAAAARMPEFAIRLALGSSHGALAGLVLKRGLWLTMAGLGLGGASVLTLRSPLQALSIAGPDPATFVLSALVIIVIGLAASAVPAVRAAAVNPVAALRHE